MVNDIYWIIIAINDGIFCLHISFLQVQGYKILIRRQKRSVEVSFLTLPFMQKPLFFGLFHFVLREGSRRYRNSEPTN
jgi:hypothetical protein